MTGSGTGGNAEAMLPNPMELFILQNDLVRCPDGMWRARSFVQQQALEEAVLETAAEWGHIEQDRANEYLRLTALGGMKGWDASQRVDADFAPALRKAQAAFEIAVAALHRASKGA